MLFFFLCGLIYGIIYKYVLVYDFKLKLKFGPFFYERRWYMYLKNIELVNFRNYNHIKVSFNKGINIIYGKNAQGKTNLLESIYLLGLTNSHRSILDNSLINNGKVFLKVKGVLKKDKIGNDLEVYIDEKKKILRYENNIVNKVSDYISIMNIIIFTPDDLDLIKGSPQVRRKFLNTELSQLYSNYYIVLNEYEKLLKIRNEYLKKVLKTNKIDENYFNILTSYLVDKAIIIYKMRQKFVDKFNLFCRNIYNDITDYDGFKIIYKKNLDVDINDSNLKKIILDKFKEKRDVEIKLTSTIYGPHRDDLEFYLNDINLKFYGSQGQQRIAVLTLKLSEIEVFKRYRNSTPILLLDDIFSEIDKGKRDNLLKYINKDIQTIITTTEIDNIDEHFIKNAKLFQINNGKIKKIKEVI